MTATTRSFIFGLITGLILMALLAAYARAATPPSGDVGPRTSADNERNERLAYPESCRNAVLGLSGSGGISNETYGAFCELGSGLSNASCDSFRVSAGAAAIASCDTLGVSEKAIDDPTLGGCVPTVVTRGPQKQMGGVAARRVIATVADKEAWWDLDTGQQQNGTVGVDKGRAVAELPVSLGDTCSGPRPAAIGAGGAIDTRPQTLGEGTGTGAHKAIVPVRGIGSWFAAIGLIAAAGPGLRVGHWRGSYVVVNANGRSIRVWLTDWCACPKRLIDLGDDAFRRLAPLSVGLVRVTVR